MHLSFQSRTVEIWTKSATQGLYAITVKAPRLASAINAVVGTYEAGTVFRVGEEPTFTLTLLQLKQVADRVPKVAKILAQILPPPPSHPSAA
jgi:hypothetical protein